MTDNNGHKKLLRLTLKEGFRNPIEYFQKGGFFVGRDRELSKLKNIITNRKTATLLLSGARGSGKTSLVRKAATEHKDSKKIAIVDVPIIGPGNNGPGPEEKASIMDRKNVLLTLVRALYFTDDIEEKVSSKSFRTLESLYNTTYLSEEKHTVGLESSNEGSVTRQQANTTEITKNFSFGENTIRAILNTVFGVGTIPLINTVGNMGLENEWQVVAIIVGYGAVWLLAASLSFKKHDTMKKTEGQNQRITEAISRGTSTVADLSDDYFEYALRSFLKENGSVKFVFIFDELDKELGLGADRIVKVLKNLFTLGNGINIFIVDEKYYFSIKNELGTDERGPDHTLFSDTIFLHQLNQHEVSQLIDDIVDKVAELADKSALEKLKHYLGWASHNMPFDLYKRLDELSDYDKQITVDIYDWHKLEDDTKLNIEKDWETGASMQAYLDTVYNDHRHPSDTLYNSVLYDSMRAICSRLKDIENIDITRESSEGYWTAANEELKTTRNKEAAKTLSEAQQNYIGDACQDLLVRMEANDQYVIVRPLLTENEKSSDEETQKSQAGIKYVFNGGPFPDKNKLGELAKSLVPSEHKFLEVYSSAQGLQRRLSSVSVTLDESSRELIAKATEQHKRMSLARRRREKISIIENTTELLQDTISSIGVEEAKQVPKKAAEKVDGVSILSPTSRHPQTGRDIQLYDPQLQDVYAKLKTFDAASCSVVVNPSKYDNGLVLLTFNLDEELLNQAISIIRSSGDIKTKLINVTYDDDSKIWSPPGVRQLKIKKSFEKVGDVAKVIEKDIRQKLFK